MSVSHNHRRKTIRKFKKQYGASWHNHFAEHCAAIRRAQAGPCIGTAADLISPMVGGSTGEVSVCPPVAP